MVNLFGLGCNSKRVTNQVVKNPAPQKASIYQSAINKRKNIIKWFSKKTVDEYHVDDSEDDDDSEYHEKPKEKQEVCTCFIQ
jgi:hypothetical protein